MLFPDASQTKDAWHDIGRQKIFLAITFHYDEGRLKYLHAVVAEIFSYPVAACVVQVYTNATDVKPLQDVLQSVASQNFEIVSVTDLQNPYDLAWAHRSAISDFADSGNEFTHFIYLEDDERLSFASFCYFLSAREVLREHGLIPSFARTEWSDARRCLMSADNLTSNDLGTRLFVRCGDVNFVALDQPYCGLYILDRQLAEEFVATRSFDKDASLEVSCWHTRERAAMGLMFEKRPPGFEARGVVPVDAKSQRIRLAATVAHLPSNYADNPCHPSAKLPLACLFDGGFSKDKAVLPRNASTPKRRGWFRRVGGQQEVAV